MVVMVSLKGVHRVRAKGRIYHYAWRGGPRLEGEPGSPEFVRSFHEAHAPAVTDTHKLHGWIETYRKSGDFRDLAPSTRKQWEPWLDRIDAKFGSLSVKQFDRPKILFHIRQWRDQWRETPRTADYGKQVLSRLFGFIVGNGHLAANPCAKIENLYAADRSEIIWTDDNLKLFCANPGVSREIAFAARFASATGFRQSDCLRAQWGHVGAHAIELRTGKSRARRRAVAPLTGDLKALLDEIKTARPGKLATTILTNSRGQPWRGFNSSWTKAMTAVWPEGKDLHFHDLRGTAATKFYLADLSLREIAETMGWREERVERLIKIYVKRDEIMRDRIRRIEAAEARTNQGGKL
jgi:integrase